MNEQRTAYVTHGELVQPTVNMSIEKNSRGTNYSITIMDAHSIEEAIAMLHDAREQLEAELYGKQEFVLKEEKEK